MSPRRVLNKLPQLAALLLLAATACQGRSDGAPDGACETMVPSHGHKPNEESTFPYQLQVSTKQVHPGGRSVGEGGPWRLVSGLWCVKCRDAGALRQIWGCESGL